MKAMTAVKKTVAPIPTYLVCSPSEQPSSKDLSAPEQRIKKFFNMIDFDLLRLFTDARID